MKTNKKLMFGIIAVIVLAAIYSVSQEPTDPKEARKKKVEAMFSPWNGEHTKLKELIKQNMNDPGSYENIETTFADMVNYILVNQQYSGKNAFGGRVKGVIEAKVDIEGNVIEIIEQR